MSKRDREIFRKAEIEGLRAIRALVIEECARVAEQAPLGPTPVDIARAIRALKDKQ